MRHWERARIVEPCGGCGNPVKVDAPIQVITLVNVTKRRIRCEGCASEPVDLEQLEAFDLGKPRDGERPRFEFTGVTRDLFDSKAGAAGDRE